MFSQATNLFFMMPYTYILDDSIKLSPTLILTADHSTLLFLISPRFFVQDKELLFFSVGEPLHDHGQKFA